MSIPTKPADFESWSAHDKSVWIWSTLIGETLYPPTARAELTMAKPWTMLSVAGPRNTLAETLERTDDLMQSDRPKIIHTQGSVALVEYVPVEDSPFTGVLAAPEDGGGAIGLIRMSLAVPPKGKAAVTPGIGLKLFLDRKPSLDLLAMNHTVGQGRDFNLFSNTFSHDLTPEHTELRPPQKLLQVFFKRVTSQPRQLTIDHFASQCNDGTTVADPVVPRRLVFRPHADVSKLFRDRHGEDYRETLERIDVGSTLYDVEAVPGDDNTDAPNRVIAQIRTTSPFTNSLGGDRLFFRHHIDPGTRRRSLLDRLLRRSS